MRLANYEKSYGLNFFILIFLILGLILLGYTIFYKINSYYVIYGVVQHEGLIEAIVNDREVTIYNKNGNYIYVDNKRIKVKSSKVIKNILKEEDSNYHDLLINCSLKNKKDGDSVKIVLRDRQISLGEIFKVIKDGD
ncbi:MAG: hypothetical protein MR031_03115 [Tenericutes bacterium]|nr:hypothetical protein [Mycoplasmatota bacterium]